MSDRPVPEALIDDDNVRTLHEYGMIVGYPDDPKIRKSVLVNLPKEIPLGIVSGLSPAQMAAMDALWRWIREEYPDE